MLEFYATSGDFTRRLTDIRANAKFSSPLSGPEDLFSVRAALHASGLPGACAVAPSSCTGVLLTRKLLWWWSR